MCLGLQMFLQRALMPLHKPKCVGMYHQQLAYCVTQVQHMLRPLIPMQSLAGRGSNILLCACWSYCGPRHDLQCISLHGASWCL